jgi:cytochrome c-type biogenesis protein CcmH/NrfG
MTDELRFPDPFDRRGAGDKDALDDRTARLIRDAYRPPVAAGEAENAYWSALERRIMARAASSGRAQSDQGWMSVLGGWAQLGLVAAAALFMTAGLVSTRFTDSDEQFGYESVVTSTPEALSAPAQLMTSSDQSVQRDAALQYVLSY